MLLVCRFVVPPAEAAEFTRRASRALELLTAAPGCQGGEFGRAVDEADRWVLLARFDSVRAYRQALSPFEVRTHVAPLLAEALTDDVATFETLATAGGGQVQAHPSLLAEDRHPAR
jgi:hypothetical protein